MATLNQEAGATLLSGFYKAVVTFTVAAIGGEVTLLHTTFPKAPGQALVYASVALLVLACLFTLGAYESLVLRACVAQAHDNGWAAFLVKWSPKSEPSETVLRALTGACTGLGLVLFAAFVIAASFCPWVV